MQSGIWVGGYITNKANKGKMLQLIQSIIIHIRISRYPYTRAI